MHDPPAIRAQHYAAVPAGHDDQGIDGFELALRDVRRLADVKAASLRHVVDQLEGIR